MISKEKLAKEFNLTVGDLEVLLFEAGFTEIEATQDFSEEEASGIRQILEAVRSELRTPKNLPFAQQQTASTAQVAQSESAITTTPESQISVSPSVSLGGREYAINLEAARDVLFEIEAAQEIVRQQELSGIAFAARSHFDRSNLQAKIEAATEALNNRRPAAEILGEYGIVSLDREACMEQAIAMSGKLKALVGLNPSSKTGAQSDI